MPAVNLTFHIQMLEAIAKAGLGDRYDTTPNGELETNCIVLGHDVINLVYDVTWTAHQYKRALLWYPEEPFSTTEVLVDKGLASHAEPGLSSATATRWFAWQFWKSLSPLKGGHFGFAYLKPNGNMLIVDATNARREWFREVPRQNLSVFFGTEHVSVVALHTTTKEWM